MRDFRDAKSMAQSLRKALSDQNLQVSHGQSLELVAKTFGEATWNAMLTRIDGGRGATEVKDGEIQTLCCNFCGASPPDARKLIVGPAVAICNVCVDECNDIILHGHLLELMRVDETRRDDGPGRLMAHLMSRDLPQVRRYLAAVRQVLENTQAALQCASEAQSARAGRAATSNDSGWDNLWPSYVCALSNRDLTDEVARLKESLKRTLALKQILQRTAQSLD